MVCATLLVLHRYASQCMHQKSYACLDLHGAHTAAFLAKKFVMLFASSDNHTPKLVRSPPVMHGDWQDCWRSPYSGMVESCMTSSTTSSTLTPSHSTQDCVVGVDRSSLQCRGPHIGAGEEGPVWLWQGEDEVHREGAWRPRRHLLDHRVAQV